MLGADGPPDFVNGDATAGPEPVAPDPRSGIFVECSQKIPLRTPVSQDN
jgi:hypothetical protein